MMRWLATCIAVLIFVVSLPSPVLADSHDEIVEWALQAFNGGIRIGQGVFQYPEPVDFSQLINAALRGVETAARQRFCAAGVSPVPAGADPLAHYKAERTAVMIKCGLPKLSVEIAAMSAMLASLKDQHTGFIPPERAQAMQDQLSGRPLFSGIGVVFVCIAGLLRVSDVPSGGPAHTAGVQRFDQLSKVDGETVDCRTDENRRRALERIRGQEGTIVIIEVKRPPTYDVWAFAIVRQPIRIPEVSGEMLFGSCVGYIKLRTFSGPRKLAVALEFLSVLVELEKQDVCGIALDMRDNSGGRFHDMLAIVSILLPTGLPIVQAAYRAETIVFLTEKVSPFSLTVPMAVLINRGSASASELTAAALQEYGRASVIGANSAGAVDLAVLILGLPGDTGMSLTIARLRTGKGVRLDGVGVTPNQVAQSDDSDFIAGRDPQLEAAIQYLLRQTR